MEGLAVASFLTSASLPYHTDAPSFRTRAPPPHPASGPAQVPGRACPVPVTPPRHFTLAWHWCLPPWGSVPGPSPSLRKREGELGKVSFSGKIQSQNRDEIPFFRRLGVFFLKFPQKSSARAEKPQPGSHRGILRI